MTRVDTKKNKRIGLVIVFVIPLLVLIGLSAAHIHTIQTGHEVLLRTEPVVNEEKESEHFVVLRYDIEDVPKQLISKELVKLMKGDSEIGQTRVYGKLERRDDVDVLVSLSEKEPEDGVYLTGWVLQTTEREFEEKEHYTVNFGLDRFYVPKKSNQASANAIQNEEMTAHLRVKNGHGILTKIVE